jgi:hypothetical protein
MAGSTCLLAVGLLLLASPQDAAAQSLTLGNCTTTTSSFLDNEPVCVSGTTGGTSGDPDALVCVLPSTGGLATDDVTPDGCNMFPAASTLTDEAVWTAPTLPGNYIVVMFASDESVLQSVIAISPVPALPLVIALPDATSDSIDDIAVIREGPIIAEIRSGTDASLHKNMAFFDANYAPIDAVALPDSNGDGRDELAVLAIRKSDNRAVVEIRNTSGIESSRVIWFAADHKPIAIRAIADDADGNSVPELAVLSRRNSDGRITVEVKNAFGPTNTNTLWFMSGNTAVDIEVVPDKDSNGIPEIAVLSSRDSDGRIVAEIKNAAGATAPSAVWFMPGNTAIDLVAVDDKDNNGIPEVAVLSSRDSDGRNVVEIKNAAGPTNPTAVWFMAGNTATNVAHIHDADNNGVPEVAVLSVRDSDGRIVVEVKNVTGATNPNSMWYSTGFAAQGLATLADTDSDSVEEAAVLMIRDSDGRILVQGRNAAGNPAPIQYWFSP